MRIHCCMAFYVAAAVLVTRISITEAAVVLMCCAAVICSEIFNSALEALCDEVSSDKNDKIGACKDMAAGAVAVCAVFSAVIGLFVFFRAGPLENFKYFVLNRPILTACGIVSLLPAFLFIKGKRGWK